MIPRLNDMHAHLTSKEFGELFKFKRRKFVSDEGEKRGGGERGGEKEKRKLTYCIPSSFIRSTSSAANSTPVGPPPQMTLFRTDEERVSSRERPEATRRDARREKREEGEERRNEQRKQSLPSLLGGSR